MRRRDVLGVAAVSTGGWSGPALPAERAGHWLSPELLDALAETAVFLAERIFADASCGDYTAENFQESPEVDRLADIARCLQASGREVPAIVSRVLEAAGAFGWGPSLPGPA